MRVESLAEMVPAPWKALLAGCDALDRVDAFLREERAAGRRWQPAPDRIFRALELTPPDAVRVVITAQDPYPGEGVPTGLAFSVEGGTRLPASLRNVFRELASDVGAPAPGSGDLTPWAERGVLLLNAALTCEPGKAGSHAGCGWHEVTEHLLRALAAHRSEIVYVCWGRPAERVAARVGIPADALVVSAHPSPLSAHRGFISSRPFTRANAALIARGVAPVDWSLPV